MGDIKILLIGCGYWGKNWYKTIKNSNYELVGVVDPSPVIDVDIPLFQTLEEVNVEYTHAILAVNAILHTDIVEKLSIPHKNILVEKPCGLNINDAQKLKNCFPGYIFLYSDEYQYIKNNLSKIGNVKYWKSIRASMGPKVRTDVSILEDYMIHDVYMYLDLIGGTSVYAKNFGYDFPKPVQASSLNLCLEDYPTKTKGYFFSSWLYPEKERKIVITGDKGSFIWKGDDLYFDSTFYDENNTVIEGNVELISTSPKSNLELELESFILGQCPDTNILEVWNMLNKIN